ncbi:MAG: ion channel [Victivallaceae bacterium]|nr:ion channel [Victivallaceae bacterium]
MKDILLYKSILIKQEINAIIKLFKNSYSLERIIDFLFAPASLELVPDAQKILKDIDYGRREALLLILRWSTPIGKECSVQLVDFINKHDQVDFENFRFTYNNESYSLEDFANLSKQKSKVGGYADIRGGLFKDICLHDKIFQNGCFNYCIFFNTHWQQTRLINCNFVHTSFFGSKLIGIRIERNVIWGECDFRKTMLNAIDFSKPSNRISTSWVYTELKYLTLLKYLIQAIKGNFTIANNDAHTVFWMLSLPTEELFDTATDYIKWYEGTHLKLQRLSRSTLVSKIMRSLIIAMTKNWSSASIFSIWAISVVLIYAFIYYWGKLVSVSYQKAISIIDCLYFSAITFTTLGFGDIVPNSSCGKVVVITEVFLGYVFLGLLLSLMSKKMKWK